MKIERLVFPDKNRCEVEQVELDETLEGDQVIVKSRVTAISPGTELAIFTRAHRGFDIPDFKFAKYPFRPGYLGMGEVVAGEAGGLKPGMRVMTRAHHQSYLKTSAAGLVPLPPEINDEDAAFLGLASIAMTAPRLAPARIGANVVVIGMGMVGNLCAQLYKASGAAAVAGADLSAWRLEKALACGIDRAFNSKEKPLSEWVKELGPRGAEWIIEAVGATHPIRDALSAIALRGTIVLLGSPREKMEIDPYFDIHRKGCSVIGAHGMHVPKETIQEDYRLFIRWILDGKLRVAPLITHRMKHTEAIKAYEGLRDRPEEYLGVVFKW